MRQIPLAIGNEPLRSFDSFVPGPNAPAVAHLRGLAHQAAPVYLWGPSGVGKTHLLHALTSQVQRLGGRASWFSAAEPVPWQFEETDTLIVLDDCDRFDEAQQQAAFALFVEATTHGIPVAAAGQVPPVDLPLREDLRSRLGWGHVFALAALSEPEARAALRREADRRGLFLFDDVMDYLLTRFARDLKHLMSVLDRLDEFALVHKRAITVPLLKQMLAEEKGS
ncbi:MAG: DnaA regulatory inactivator Hda [Cytophagales bacterium]|nr:DnaA regulatory inactivator Hda [Rhizobacter sp.]